MRNWTGVLPGLACLLLAGLAAGQEGRGAYGDAWDWPLPPRRYSGLSASERMQFERAEDLFRKKNYEAAAIEFEKYMAQNPKTGATPHALLLRGYSLHLARKRNAAIALYTEALDFYSGDPDVAVPALYLMAAAHMENGNLDKGIKALKDLTENEKYLVHPLSDLAWNKLAEYYIQRKDEKAAEACWRKVVEQYSAALVRPEAAAREAKTKLIDYYMRKQRYSALEEVMTAGIEDPRRLPDVAIFIFDRGIAEFAKFIADEKDAFYRWFKNRRRWFSEAERTSDWLGRILQAAQMVGAREDWNGFMQTAIEECRGTPAGKRAPVAQWVARELARANNGGWKADPSWKEFSAAILGDAQALPAGEQTRFYGEVMAAMFCKMDPNSEAEKLWNTLVARTVEVCKGLFEEDRDQGLQVLVDRLRQARRFEQAMEVVRNIENPALARWKEAEILGNQEKYAEMAAACEDVEKMDDKALSIRALRTRAELYKNQLARYEEAIRLYNDINDPPGTSWAVVECYERWKKPDEAVAMCSEIENFFEQDAPVAGFRKAQIWDAFKDKDRAIAACRAVLKKYPKHQVSSQAHQMLERYGIQSGGGVIEAED